MMSLQQQLSRIVRSRPDGPCGNTSVSDGEVDEARRLFNQQVSTVASGLSIVQQLAVNASRNTTVIGNKVTNPPTDYAEYVDGGVVRGTKTTVQNPPATSSLSRNVVNSHLQYLHKYMPFREGNFSKDTLYGFVFFAVVEKQLRMGYAKRVLRNILSYVRRYLTENPTTESGDSGGGRLLVPIEKKGRRSSTMEILLSPTSVAFFRENPHGIVVQSKRFYQLMNAIANQTNNERLRNIVCEARRPRELVFSDDQNAALLSFVCKALRVIVDKYSNRFLHRDTAAARIHGNLDELKNIDPTVNLFVSPDPAFNTDRRQLTVEQTLFEFCVAFLLGFLTGARIKSTVMRLTVSELDGLTRGNTVEKFAKSAFVRVFIPEGFTTKRQSNSEPIDSRDEGIRHLWNIYTDPPSDNHDISIGNLLFEIAPVRRNPYLYEGSKSDQESFFLNSGRQLDYVFNRIYAALFDQPRPKGVFWHSQRRRYLGSVNDKCGAVTASKSVGHADVETTMQYINKSMHKEDTNRKAGTAIYEEAIRLMGCTRKGHVEPTKLQYSRPLTLQF